MRPLVGKTGKLPRPLAESLIQELDRNDWFRDKVVEHTPGLDVDDARSDAAISALFLLRPPEWRERLAGLEDKLVPTADAHTGQAEIELRRALVRNEALEKKIARLQGELAQRQAERRVPKQSSAGSTERVKARLEARVFELEAELAEARVSITGAERRLRQLGRRNARPTVAAQRSSTGTKGTPLAIARQLDTQLAALRVLPVAAAGTAVASRQRPKLRLPSGVAPDRPEAVAWLVGEPALSALAIDGWNLAHLWKSPPGKRERNRVESVLAKFGRAREKRTVSPARLMAFFDSGIESEPTLSDHPYVELFFPPSADQALIDFAAPGVVVVTSDRRVREECDARGAVTIWSEAVAEWLAPRA